MKDTCSRVRQQGFSLLEVLVAFAVLALSLGVLAEIFSRTAESITTVRSTAEALILAESLLSGAVRDSGPGAVPGTGPDRFQWEITFAPYTPHGSVPRFPDRGSAEFMVATVKVNWRGRDQHHQLELVSLKPAFFP